MWDICCFMSGVWCQTSDTWCRRSDVLCLVFDVWQLMFDVSCQTYIWWQTTDVRRLICAVGGLMSYVWCLTFDVWHLLSDVWYLMTDIWCQTSGAPNNTTCANNLCTSGISMHQFLKDWKTKALYVRSLQYTSDFDELVNRNQRRRKKKRLKRGQAESNGEKGKRREKDRWCKR